MLRTFIILFADLVIAFFCNAQENLVPNHSFEIGQNNIGPVSNCKTEAQCRIDEDFNDRIADWKSADPNYRVICPDYLILASSLTQDTSHTDSVKQERKNVVYLELLGSGGAYSLNYEHQLMRNNLIIINVRVGIEIGSRAIGMPTGFIALFGRKHHNLELGSGITHIIGQEQIYHSYKNGFSYLDSWLLGIIGYRYYSNFHKTMFRISYTPIYFFEGQNGSNHLYQWAGVSIGLKF